jgi:S1-C subfamily serine protease
LTSDRSLRRGELRFLSELRRRCGISFFGYQATVWRATPLRQVGRHALLLGVFVILAVVVIIRYSDDAALHPPVELDVHPEILLRQVPADSAVMDAETLYLAVRHSVVKVNVLVDQALIGHGSGVVLGVDRDGQLYVLTNRHVVYHEVANPHLVSYEIQLENGIQLPAILDFYSRTHDLAVVVAPGLSGWGLPVGLRMCSDLSVGEEVFALGSPIGLDHSFTKGVISALRWPMIQTDATIHSGSSGGPLFDHRGRVCGVVTASHTGKNFSFALCGETVLEMLDERMAAE